MKYGDFIESTEKMVEVMTECINGALIEQRKRKGRYKNIWVDSPRPSWDWLNFEYRAIPRKIPNKKIIWEISCGDDFILHEG